MKKLIIFVSILFICESLFTRGNNEETIFKEKIDFLGYYSADLYVNENITLPLIFEIQNNIVLFSSPDQMLNDFEVSYEINSKNEIRIYSDLIKFEIIGQKSANDIIGTFKQNGMEIPIVLFKTEKKEKPEIIRYQTPTEISYQQKNVEIINKTNFNKYYGTLTIPQDKEKNDIVIFISGSGIQDRNEELFAHKPFFVISDFLTNNGYYTLRCDDYGYHGEDVSNHTTFDIANDIRAQINYLRENYDFNNYILLGHSEGGIVAQILSNEVDKLILMASPAISGAETYKNQVLHSLIIANSNQSTLDFFDSKIDDVITVLLDDSKSIEERKDIILPYFAMFGNDASSSQQSFNVLNSSWYRTFLKLDPRDYLKQITIPTLILQGSNDTQVEKELNIPVFKELLNNENNIIIYDTFNHLMQASETGELSEYGKIETTIEEIVLEDILSFLEEKYE